MEHFFAFVAENRVKCLVYTPSFSHGFHLTACDMCDMNDIALSVT